MKLFLSVSAMLATGALAASHEGATPAMKPEKGDGQTDCKKDMGGTEVEFFCEYYETCITAKNASFSQCIPTGNKECYKYKELGESGEIRSASPMGCAPYQTCCDGACCGANEQCMEVWGNNNEGPPVSFMYGDEMVANIDMVARNGWKTAKAVTIVNKPRKCVPLADAPIMDVTSGMKAVYMPLLGLGVTLLIFVIAIVKRQDTFLAMLFPLCTIIFSFFLVLTEGWVMALMCTFVAAATMAAGDQDKKWLVFFQLFFMWVYFGGSSYLIFAGTAGKNFFSEASDSTIDELSLACSKHFDYYKLHNYQVSWDMDPNNVYTGICGREFIGYQIFIAYGQAIALFLMVTTTVVGYLNPGGPSETTKNPAVEMAA